MGSMWGRSTPPPVGALSLLLTWALLAAACGDGSSGAPTDAVDAAGPLTSTVDDLVDGADERLPETDLEVAVAEVLASSGGLSERARRVVSDDEVHIVATGIAPDLDGGDGVGDGWTLQRISFTRRGGGWVSDGGGGGWSPVVNCVSASGDGVIEDNEVVAWDRLYVLADPSWTLQVREGIDGEVQTVPTENGVLWTTDPPFDAERVSVRAVDDDGLPIDCSDGFVLPGEEFSPWPVPEIPGRVKPTPNAEDPGEWLVGWMRYDADAGCLWLDRLGGRGVARNADPELRYLVAWPTGTEIGFDPARVEIGELIGMNDYDTYLENDLIVIDGRVVEEAELTDAERARTIGLESCPAAGIITMPDDTSRLEMDAGPGH